DAGGLNLFSVKDRNDAQYLAWVSAFLAPPESRPLWAFVADPILKARTVISQRSRIPIEDRRDPLTQAWRPNVSRLPLILARLVTTARKYRLSPDLPFIPQKTREQVPIWVHHALDQNNMHKNRAALRCLRTKHEIHTVEDLEEIAEGDELDHESVTDCDCGNCEADRGIGCRAPYKCQGLAADLLSEIPAKWHPHTPAPQTPRDLWEALADGRHDALREGEMIVFDSSIPLQSSLQDMCRVFGEFLALDPHNKTALHLREQGEPPYQITATENVTAIVCAGMYKDCTDNARGGYSIHFPELQYADISSACPEQDPSFTKTSAFAICETINCVDPRSNLHIVSTSQFVVEALTTSLSKHEDAGWTTVPSLAKVMRATVAALRSRSAETTFTFVNKKRAKIWREVKETKARAQTAAIWSEESDLDVSIWRNFDLPGVRANRLDQRKAHRAIRNQNIVRTPPRRVTAANLLIIQSSVKAECDHMPTEKQIWESLSHRDIPKNIKAFMWKGIHGAHKIGEYFEKMPEPWKSKSNCPTCHVTESMQHILFECPDSHQQVIWSLVQALLAVHELEIDLNIGIIWGCACMRLPSNGAERLLRILISESAFLIWKIRCEKRVAHSDDPDWKISDREAGERWKTMVGTRSARDARLRDERRYG
ncbi:hypothetical protein AURDEDRAFT_38674, partial [Auricularia subglabra TFB-10046 SS5]